MHRVLVDHPEPPGLQRPLGEPLEPTARQPAVDALVEQLQHGRRPRHAVPLPTLGYRTDPIRRVAAAQHRVERPSSRIAPI
jgi:hypothetical protein